MPEVTFNGPAGRIEGRYQPSKQRGAPIAIVLHPHPQFGGTMNNKIVYDLFSCFVAARLFGAALQFPRRRPQPGHVRSRRRRAVGRRRSARLGAGRQPRSRACWIAGVSFGAWIGMQLLMRRPEIEGFISVAPPANRFDFSFLAPCPSSGLIVHGDADRVAPLQTSRRWSPS